MKHANFLMVGVLTSAIGLSGCATDMAGTIQSSGNAYTTAQAGVMQVVQTGTILALVPVKIAQNGGGAGTAAGAVAGGLLDRIAFATDFYPPIIAVFFEGCHSGCRLSVATSEWLVSQKCSKLASNQTKQWPRLTPRPLFCLVGDTGFEPVTPAV